MPAVQESVEFTVAGVPQYDNGTARLHVERGSTATERDVYVYDSDGRLVAQSAQGGTNREDALLVDPPAGTYRAVFVNDEGGQRDDWTVASVTPTVGCSPRATWSSTAARRCSSGG